MIKLEHFNSEIMAGVTEKKKQIEEEQVQQLKEEYDAKELEYLESAYDIIQHGLKEIDREKNEIMSKTLMQNKVTLLNKRKEIIGTVFAKVEERLRAYTEEDAYKAGLVTCIQKRMEEMGGGEYTLFINNKDQRLCEFLQETFPQCRIEVEPKHMDSIGGVKLLNTTKNIFVDESYGKYLEEEREPFLQRCDIKINSKGGE